MFDFLDKLFQSELVKTNWIAVLAYSLFLVILGGVGVWLYHRLFKNKHIQDKLSNTSEKLEDTKKQLEELKEKNDELTEKLHKYEIMEQIDASNESEKLDAAVAKFVKK